MAKRRKTETIIPSARRLIKSLRDVGYDLGEAVADLVDNSITARATKVDIDLHFDAEDSWIRISDNGRGMSKPVIREAMRFGSETEHDCDDMGRFGLGLKTASISQCLRLTVASRSDKRARRIEVLQWDLDHVYETNEWEVIALSNDQRPDHLIAPLASSTGTVVVWDRLDRILGYKNPWGKNAKKGLLAMAEELDAHLGMVFHRYLQGEAGRRKKRKLRIRINGAVVEPWDPFVHGEKSTMELSEAEFDIAYDEGRGSVGYSGYILPPKDKFSSEKAHERAGRRRWNQHQGFYVYRADRMIQSGGWSKMRSVDEHTKLARAAIDFWPDMDSAFRLSVSKTYVVLPDDLREELAPRVERLVKRAREVYDRSGGTSKDGRRGSGVRGGRGSRDTPKALTPRKIGKAVDTAAKAAGETRALKRVKRVLREGKPEVADELGW